METWTQLHAVGSEHHSALLVGARVILKFDPSFLTYFGLFRKSSTLMVA